MKRTRRLSTLPIATMLFAFGPGAARASTTVIDFEDLPDAYFFSSGDQNIGTFYSGIASAPT